MFITFEGIDTSGKSTQIKLLANWCAENKISHYPTAEPTSEYREKILSIKSKLSEKEELFLFLLDRVKHCEQKILPWLKDKHWVICDRFDDSTIAYQGYGRGMIKDRNFMNAVKCASIVSPQLTFFLDIPYSIMFERKTGRQFDRMESEGKSFYEKVIDGYKTLVKTNKKRYYTIDATKTTEEVHSEIISTIKEKINER